MLNYIFAIGIKLCVYVFNWNEVSTLWLHYSSLLKLMMQLKICCLFINILRLLHDMYFIWKAAQWF